ncbi:ras-related protein Rab-1B-like [Polymixia lowei]
MEEEATAESSRSRSVSVSSGCLSMKTDRSMGHPITFKEEGAQRLRSVSVSSGCLSTKTDDSVERPITFKDGTQWSTNVFVSGCLSTKTDDSVERPITFTDGTQCYMFKLLLVGNLCVGKTCLLYRFKNNDFCNHNSTAGCNMENVRIHMYRKKVILQIYDVSGQERYRSNNAAHYRGTHGFIIVYDVTNQDSFDHLTTWLWDIETRCDNNVSKLLVGNKSDLTARSEVDSTAAQELAAGRGMPFLETSAKTGDNVQKAFLTITRSIMKQRGLDHVHTEPPGRDSICRLV